ncbi:MAG: branched-chain amino acid ABC transporter permease [Acidimicrobiia bacterium]|nr:MAG: branched-chain amino acid ABC transporter permease [Acidimicrobiia bacterium]
MADAVIIAQAAEGIDKFSNTLISGLALGAIYAILALGFVLIFKATQVVNFAHGAIAAFGAYMVVYFAVVLNFPGRFLEFLPYTAQWALSALLAVAATALLGIVIERVAIRPMIGKALFAVAIITLGLDLIIRTITNDLMGNQSLGLADPWGARVRNPFGGIRVADTQIVTLAVTVVLVLLLAWFFRTRTGTAMRATAFDQEAALAQGINVGRMFALAWAIGSALAAIGGIFTSVFPRGAAGVSPFTAFIAFGAFPAVVIGGLDSIMGAIVGGLLVGLVEVFVASYSGLGIGFSAIVPWLLMMAVLLVKPYGIFGTEEVRRV